MIGRAAQGSGFALQDGFAVEVIIKIAERCNINCDYCYFFNSNDSSFRHHPRFIGDSTIDAVIDFLRQGIMQYSIPRVMIDFHGGEPLLLAKSRFDALCSRFDTALAPLTELALRVQTNCTLVDSEWVNIFAKWRVAVGTSIDGSECVHDSHRVDFRGRGTYARTVRGLRLLQQAAQEGRIVSPGVLCVIQPDENGAAVYRHLVHALGARRVDFLLPGTTHDYGEQDPNAECGRFLTEVFDAWLEDGDVSISVRSLEGVLSLLQGGPTTVVGLGRPNIVAFTISSDGSLGPDDLLRLCGPEIMDTGLKVDSCSLADFLQSPLISALSRAADQLPEGCNACCWKYVCRGGHLPNRYGNGRGFDNPSAHCKSLRRVYTRAAVQLLSEGVPVAELMHSLGLTSAGA